MKMYVKTTSERASKGQGGNDYVGIDITVGSATEPITLAKFTVRPTAEGYAVYDEHDTEIRAIMLEDKGKGKQQKDCSDCKKLGWCDAHAEEAGER